MSKVRELGNIEIAFSKICAEREAQEKKFCEDLMLVVLRLDYLIPEESSQKKAIRALPMLPMAIKDNPLNAYYLDPFTNQWFWLDKQGRHNQTEVFHTFVAATFSALKQIIADFAGEAECIDQDQNTKEERR